MLVIDEGMLGNYVGNVGSDRMLEHFPPVVEMVENLRDRCQTGHPIPQRVYSP